MTNTAHQDRMKNPLKPILETLFTQLGRPEQQKRQALTNRWPSIVGQFFAQHTKPKFGERGQVLVCVDDSTRAFELSQRYKIGILKRLQNEFGEEEIKDVRFFVGEL